ncbi:helix-turn-helix domain-containing protein [Solwaraspora sp. WMMB335]|uniref:GbsR/MarR family transcriptional regulator n=1 Tax=Solwaraspora sp. WMMB335 TaxID=3404118 RepID=UPI003B958FFF
MPGGRLSYRDRQHIAQALAGGTGYAEIARQLGRPTSTISREVGRNGGPGGYRADAAHRATGQRARRAGPVVRPVPDHTSRYDRDPAAVREFETYFAGIMIQSGFPRMMARVLVSLFVSDTRALTAGELVARLNVSAASVSKAVAFLERLGFVTRQRVPGQRRDRYVVDEDVWHRAWSMRARAFGSWAAAASRGAEVFGPETPAGERLRLMADFFDLVRRDVEQVTVHWQEFLDARRQPAGTRPSVGGG